MSLLTTQWPLPITVVVVCLIAGTFTVYGTVKLQEPRTAVAMPERSFDDAPSLTTDEASAKMRGGSISETHADDRCVGCDAWHLGYHWHVLVKGVECKERAVSLTAATSEVFGGAGGDGNDKMGAGVQHLCTAEGIDRGKRRLIRAIQGGRIRAGKRR